MKVFDNRTNEKYHKKLKNKKYLQTQFDAYNKKK